jgi:hypothetical protein
VRAFVQGYGGHVMAHGIDATLRVSGVELVRMGQTNIVGRCALLLTLTLTRTLTLTLTRTRTLTLTLTRTRTRTLTLIRTLPSPSPSPAPSTPACGRTADPLHAHLMGESGGARSFVLDASVHTSYYRCLSVHGTHNLTLAHSVAYDAIGHCWYAHCAGVRGLAAHACAHMHVRVALTHSSRRADWRNELRPVCIHTLSPL